MIKARRTIGRAAILATFLAVGGTAAAQSPCGAWAEARAGETLADIAERCDVPASDVIAANPALGRDALAAGTRVALPTDMAELLDRTRHLLFDLGRELEGAARIAGETITEYLSRNPDIGRDILEFGQRYGLPGFETAPPPAGGADTVVAAGSVVVTPENAAPGEQVMVRAAGLPPAADAVISIGPPGTDTDEAARAKTSAGGEMVALITLPDWTIATDTIVLVIESGDVRLTSETYAVADAR